VLTIILSPTSLLAPGEIGAEAGTMPVGLKSFVDRADKEKTFRAFLRDGAGLNQSPQEQSAGAKGLFDTAPLLTRADLPPQTFYQSLTRVGKSAVFNFALRYEAAGHKSPQDKTR